MVLLNQHVPGGGSGTGAITSGCTGTSVSPGAATPVAVLGSSGGASGKGVPTAGSPDEMSGTGFSSDGATGAGGGGPSVNGAVGARVGGAGSLCALVDPLDEAASLQSRLELDGLLECQEQEQQG